MSNELQARPAEVEIDATASLMDVISRAAKDPSVDIEKMKELMAMARELRMEQRQVAFSQAMKAAQDEMVPIVRNAENTSTHSRYATLDAIDEAIRPVYTRHGFSLTFNSPGFSKEEGVSVSCTVMHEQGHSREYSLQGELDMTGFKGVANKTAIQGLSSTMTYLQRILTRMIFNLTFKNADKDGNAPSVPISEDQVMTIHDMFVAASMGADRQARFCEIFGIKIVSDLPRSRYAEAMTQLQAAVRKAEGK